MSFYNDDDHGFDRAWDNYYNQCHCMSDDEDCHFCRWETAEEAQTVLKAVEENQLRATGWYDEIITIRGLIRAFEQFAEPEMVETRVRLFGQLFTVLAGYEKFLAAYPKMRAVVADKLAECRADPRTSEKLKGEMDRLDAVLARL